MTFKISDLGYATKDEFYEVMAHCPHEGCTEVCRGGCKCARSDRRCANGHEWHKCWAHDIPRIVLAGSDHSRAGTACTCDLGESFPWPPAEGVTILDLIGGSIGAQLQSDEVVLRLVTEGGKLYQVNMPAANALTMAVDMEEIAVQVLGGEKPGWIRRVWRRMIGSRVLITAQGGNGDGGPGD